ncbi:MAG: hypothetical protein QOG23_308 [Blastocatellia bacterium]|jgi:hypothetical protein|nr:hypothetical protein [Blastocatellia bacterium]
MRAMATLKPKRNVSPDDFRRKFLLVTNFVLACTLVFVSSCGGSLFKVKPAAALPPMPATVASANLGSISFRAAPLLTDEESQELFESNLQLAGLLPVRIEISHNGGDSIELKRVHFLLTDAAGTKWKMISAKQAIARILKANDVFAYNPASRKTFEQEFRAYELNLKSPLTHNEGRRQGFIIFLAPGKAPVSAPRGLVLTIEGLSQTANLKLN